MKVLMISLDKGLLGKGELGDVTSRHKEYGKFVEKLDIIVFSKIGFEKHQLSENVTSYPTNSKSKLFYHRNAKKIGKELFSKNKYDLVVTQAPFITGLVGYQLAKKFKAKLLIHFHGDYVNNKLWLKEKWYNIILVIISKYLAKRADGIRVMSNGIKNKLIKSGISQDKIRVISTPVSLMKFGNWDKNVVLELKEQYQNKKILLFVGRLSKEKDLPTLLKALEEVKRYYQNFVLLILGDGNQKDKWIKMTAEMNLENEVKFLGSVEHEDLVNFYPACEFVINSSTSESFGKIFVEAAAVSKPSVATATTGAQEIIIENETGLLSPVGESQKLASNILKLIQNKELTNQLGKQAKESVSKRFDGGINTKEIINYWEELVK